MQIVTDAAEARIFVRNMSQSLADPAYWEKWQLIALEAKPPLDWIKQAKATALLRPHLPDSDGSLLWVEGGLLAVSPKMELRDIAQIQENIQKTTGAEEIRLTVLSFAGNLNEVKKLLARVEGAIPTQNPPPASYHLLKSLVPDIDNLLRGWHREMEARQERAKPLIMIVDDDAMTIKLVSNALAKEYEIETAANGAEAIAKHLQLMPDIILLDIGLPDCDGLTVLNYMQQYDRECRVVMFSADDFLKTRVRAFAGGAKGFLGKPFNFQAFQRQVAEWFAGKETKN